MNLRRWLPSTKRACSAAVLVLALSGCASVTISDPIPPPPAIPPSATPNGLAMMPTASPRPRRTPTATSVTAVEATPTTRPTITPTPEPILYTVASGDTLSEIATKYAVSLEDLMAINNLTNAHQLSLGQILIIPSAADIVGEYAPAMTTEGHIVHFVREGETISAIASQYGVTREDVLFANGFRPDVQLFAGDQIVVPQGEFVALATATLPPLEPVATSALALAPTETPASVPQVVETPTLGPTPTPQIHTVQSGEIAGAIAAEYDITVNALAGANPNANMERLSIGQQLTIPTPAPSTPGANATPTAVTLEPTATPTPIPPIMGSYMVAEGETWASVATRYGVSEDALKAYNSTVTGDLTAGATLQVPLGTATPVPTPTSPPTMTPTPAPAYMEPLPLLPANGSTWVHWAGKSPLTLLWTSSGILAPNEYYVVRVRALDAAGEMIWDDSYWTQATSLKLEEETLANFTERVTLRWDVMVMRQTSRDGETPRTGEALSNKSQTWEILFSYSVAPRVAP